MRPLALLAVLMLTGSLVADDKKDEKIDPAKLVGRWQRTTFQGRAAPEAEAEFTPKGVLWSRITFKEGIDTAEYKYKLTGANLEVEMWKGMTVTMDVLKLTDSALHTKDSEGRVQEFVRVKEEKKDK